MSGADAANWALEFLGVLFVALVEPAAVVIAIVMLFFLVGFWLFLWSRD